MRREEKHKCIAKLTRWIRFPVQLKIENTKNIPAVTPAKKTTTHIIKKKMAQTRKIKNIHSNHGVNDVVMMKRHVVLESWWWNLHPKTSWWCHFNPSVGAFISVIGEWLLQQGCFEICIVALAPPRTPKNPEVTPCVPWLSPLKEGPLLCRKVPASDHRNASCIDPWCPKCFRRGNVG